MLISLRTLGEYRVMLALTEATLPDGSWTI
jgi:hypothetical protein